MRVLLCLALLIPLFDGKHIGLHGLETGEHRGFVGQEVINAPWNISCKIPICEGPLQNIYCTGNIVQYAWRFGVYDTCPGPILRFEPDIVLANFESLQLPIEKETFVKFCEDNFERRSYLELTRLHDFVENATFLEKIKDPAIRKFAFEVNKRWSTLARRFVPEMRNMTSRLPVLTVPNPFIVPGGFFQVYFYWDSYWIMKGLLVSNMTETAKGILENFAYVLKTHGFLPNSGNIQLSRRTQPPLFVQMLDDYFTATKDKDFLRLMMPLVEIEMDFWMRNRTIQVLDSNGKNRTMYLYRSITTCPRPENYLVDVDNGINGSYDPEEIWSSVASACESGWDFSSRWFDHTGKQAFTKYTIRTNTILPVDVNAFMTWNFRAVAGFYKILGDEKSSNRYQLKYKEMAENLALLWNEEAGVWQDYDMAQKAHRNDFYPSNVYPLLAMEVDKSKTDKIREYLQATRVLEYPGGIPSTLKVLSTQQWDFPNVWAPNVHLFVEALMRTEDPYLREQAVDAARRFVVTVKNGLMNPKANVTATIWEKYDARFSDGSRGDGGEYYVQEGFGWTNGAVLDFINKYFMNSTISNGKWTHQKPYSQVLTEDELNEIFGNGVHTVVIVGLMAVLMVLILWFLIFGLTSSKICSLRNLLYHNEEATQRLLGSDDSS
ncbi:unnamed protein product, partial [Mesorhabditis spiculigera]